MNTNTFIFYFYNEFSHIILWNPLHVWKLFWLFFLLQSTEKNYVHFWTFIEMKLDYIQYDCVSIFFFKSNKENTFWKWNKTEIKWYFNWNERSGLFSLVKNTNSTNYVSNLLEILSMKVTMSMKLSSFAFSLPFCEDIF